MTRRRVLLTVPHLASTFSPHREMMAIATHLPRDEFVLTICSLQADGEDDTVPQLRELGVDSFSASFRPTGRTVMQVLSAVRDQAAIARRGPFDIQHSLDYTSMPFEAVFAKTARRYFIRHQRSFNENGSRLMLRATIACADRTVAITDAVQEFLGAMGARSTRIYSGLDLHEFERLLSPSPSRQPGYFLSVGHLERRKRHEDAIKALGLVVKNVPHARVGIVGSVLDSQYESELLKLATDLRLDSRVELLGSRNDVPQLMQQAEAVLLCSDSEAFGWVLIEAMAAKVPVIASRSGGPVEVVIPGETGFLVSVGDINGYAEAMECVLVRPDEVERLRVAGRRRVQDQFSARTMVSQIADLYRSVGDN